MTPTLESAITQAVEAHKNDLPTVEEQVPVVESPAVETVVEETPIVEQPQLDQDAEQGRILVQGLRDPEKAGIIIDFLARQAGYTKGTVETKQEVKEAKAGLTAILEAELGDELKFIAPKLGTALNKYFETLKQEPDPEIANLRTRVENQEREKLESEANSIHTVLAQEYFGKNEMPVEVMTAFSQALDEFPPREGSNLSTYYRKIFSFVAGERGLTKQTVKQSDRIAKNKQDAPARTLAETNRGVTPSVDGNARKMSLGDSVAKAMAEVNEKMGKQ